MADPGLFEPGAANHGDVLKLITAAGQALRDCAPPPPPDSSAAAGAAAAGAAGAAARAGPSGLMALAAALANGSEPGEAPARGTVSGGRCGGSLCTVA
jgi:hypothetical protein